MTAKVISFPRVVPDPESNAKATESIELSQLFAVLGEIEAEFVELTERLQLEREHMVSLELPQLVDNALAKDALLKTISGRASTRRAVFERAWSWAEGAPDELPETVPGALRAIAPRSGERRPELEAAATRLDALMDAIQELQSANRSLVQRALSWIDGYLSEITGDVGAKSYDASGRLRDRASPLLRRTV